MRKFILNATQLFLPIIFIAIFLEVLLRQIPNDYTYKKKYLDAHSNDIECLILGSSDIYYGVNPIFFSEKTFNAGYISQSLNFDFEIFEKYKGNFKNLNTVIIDVSYLSFVFDLRESPESWRASNYVMYYGINSNNFSDHTEIFSNKFKMNLMKLSSFYIKGNSRIGSSNFGWGTNYKSENAKDLIRTGKKEASIHNKLSSKDSRSFFNQSTMKLNSVIEWCQDRNIKVILITPPTFESYRKNLNANQLNVMMNTASKIASKYDNCVHLNLFEDTSFMAKDFYDANHLSEIGAKKLSILINQEIINGRYITNPPQKTEIKNSPTPN